MKGRIAKQCTVSIISKVCDISVLHLKARYRIKITNPNKLFRNLTLRSVFDKTNS